MRDFVDVTELDKETILRLFDTTNDVIRRELHKRGSTILRNKNIILAFFEPSTRTRLSFEIASRRLGADVLTVVGEEATSLNKGESFSDTVRMFDILGDLLVLRHPRDGAAKYASELAEIPVINAGDGKNQHPTQTLIDLYTIYRKLGTIDGLSYAVVGDLRYARTAHSFLLALTLFNPKSVYLVSPPQLRPSDSLLAELRERKLRFYMTEKLSEVVDMVDVLYITRIQKERFPDPEEYEKVKGSYRLTYEMIKDREKPIILHPLPRVDELDNRIDKTKVAAYFDQVKFSVPVRMSIIAWTMGVEL